MSLSCIGEVILEGIAIWIIHEMNTYFLDIPQLKYDNIHFKRKDSDERGFIFQYVYSLSSTSMYIYLLIICH